MLNFDEFQEHIKNTILDYLPEEFSDAKVDLQQVAKNNETLTGIIIHQEKVNISPTIYLDPFYKEYMSGSKDLDTVMGEIGQIYVQNAPDNNFDVSRITDFELVKDCIIAKVICMENNEKLLEGKPYRQMADLAVTYHVLLSKEARSYMQDDFYILPSSVHEVLLVKQNQMSVEELEDMVKTVNASAVALQDRLSDHVYKYDFARHEIYRADQEQQRQAELNAEQARTHAAGR